MRKIDTAVDADLPGLVELLEVLFTQEADFRPDSARQEPGLRLILSRSEAGRSFVMRRHDAIPGSVSTVLGGGW